MSPRISLEYQKELVECLAVMAVIVSALFVIGIAVGQVEIVSISQVGSRSDDVAAGMAMSQDQGQIGMDPASSDFYIRRLFVISVCLAVSVIFISIAYIRRESNHAKEKEGGKLQN